jgi:uncharacterized protein
MSRKGGLEREREKQRQRQLEELRCRLEEANRVSSEALAVRIREIGFQCLRCGECCTGEENSVVVFPFEIRRIMGFTGESWQETVEPPSVGEWDRMGNFHTLEWRIKKCEKSCKFHHFEGCRCSIYEARPLLCSTYPFYLEDGDLLCSECRGLGKAIDAREAGKIADLLKERNIVEIREAIHLLENYKDFQRGCPGKGACIVHDSEGEHKIGWDQLPALRRIPKI